MKILHMTIRSKIYVLIGLSVLGLIGSIVSMSIIQRKVWIGGPSYQLIVQNKDLVADILPPPEYIIETYLTVLQLRFEKDPVLRKGLIDKCAALKKDYEMRHEVWARDLPEGPMRTGMLELSYQPAVKFYELLDKQFVPAVLQNDEATIKSLVEGEMLALYRKHREAIDNVVDAAGKETISLEERTAVTLRKADQLIAVLAIFFCCSIVGMGVWMGRGIVKSIFQLTARLKDVAQGDGDLTQRIPILTQDEVGELARWFNTFVDKLHSLASHRG